MNINVNIMTKIDMFFFYNYLKCNLLSSYIYILFARDYYV